MIGRGGWGSQGVRLPSTARPPEWSHRKNRGCERETWSSKNRGSTYGKSGRYRTQTSYSPAPHAPLHPSPWSSGCGWGFGPVTTPFSPSVSPNSRTFFGCGTLSLLGCVSRDGVQPAEGGAGDSSPLVPNRCRVPSLPVCAVAGRWPLSGLGTATTGA